MEVGIVTETATLTDLATTTAAENVGMTAAVTKILASCDDTEDPDPSMDSWWVVDFTFSSTSLPFSTKGKHRISATVRQLLDSGDLGVILSVLLLPRYLAQLALLISMLQRPLASPSSTNDTSLGRISLRWNSRRKVILSQCILIGSLFSCDGRRWVL